MSRPTDDELEAMEVIIDEGSDTDRYHAATNAAALLRACKGGVSPDARQDEEWMSRYREAAYQAYINEMTPNGNTRITNATLCAGPDERQQRHIATQMDMAFQAGWQEGWRAGIEAAAKVAKSYGCCHVPQEIAEEIRALAEEGPDHD